MSVFSSGESLLRKSRTLTAVAAASVLAGCGASNKLQADPGCEKTPSQNLDRGALVAKPILRSGYEHIVRASDYIVTIERRILNPDGSERIVDDESVPSVSQDWNREETYGNNKYSVEIRIDASKPNHPVASVETCVDVIGSPSPETATP